MRIWENQLLKRASQGRIAVIAAAALAILSANAPSASAQAIYDSLSNPVTNQTGQVQANNRFAPGVQYTLNYGSSAVTNGRVVTPLMADDLFLQSDGSGGSYSLNSISFSVFNQVQDNQTLAGGLNLGANGAMTVTPYLTIWSPDGSTPQIVSPTDHTTLAYPDADTNTPGYQPSSDTPGSKLFRVALPAVTIAAATSDGNGHTLPSSAIVNVNSATLNGLTLPFIGNNKYWFGLVFDQPVDATLTAAQQTARMSRIALGLYNPTVGLGHSADVHFETFDQITFPQNDPSYTGGYLGAGGPGYYDSNTVWQQGYYTSVHQIYGTGPTGLNDPTANSNFGWLINGTIVIPEPGVGALLLFGLPFAGAILRRRRK